MTNRSDLSGAARQLRLNLKRPSSHARSDFVTGSSNADAVAAVDAWPRWHGGCLALIGVEGVGKTHLAHCWALAAGAVILDREKPDLNAATDRPVLVEDVDRGFDDLALFHLINRAALPGGGLLLTGRTTPTGWHADLPDLRSRLNALAVAEIEPPDDQVLRGVLQRFFTARNIRPPSELYPYVLQRMHRSVPAAWEMVERLDEIADQEGRSVSKALARRSHEDDAENLDLFDG